jgi:nucleotide-binding universal stress UspA family protein
VNQFQPNPSCADRFSESSERAFRKAIDNSKAYSAKLVVLHVVRVLPLSVGDYWSRNR